MAFSEKCHTGINYHVFLGELPSQAGRAPCCVGWVPWVKIFSLHDCQIGVCAICPSQLHDEMKTIARTAPAGGRMSVSECSTLRRIVLLLLSPESVETWSSIFQVSYGNRTNKWSQLRSYENNNTFCDLEVWRFMLAPTGMLMCKESGLSSQTLTNTSHFLLIGFNLTSILLSPKEYFI